MNRKVILEWDYKPDNFLEEDHDLDFYGHNIHFEKGMVVLETDENHLKNSPFFVTNAEKAVKNFLNGVSICSHSTYELGRKATKRISEDGIVKLDPIFLGIESTVSVSSHIEFQIKDKNGNIVRDSKKERIEDKRNWGNLVSQVNDHNQPLINSYLNAIRDKKNEIIHLYEVRDFVENKFGSSEKARSNLLITKKKWKLFGKIANTLPILEGRHRGKYSTELRKATPEELREVRIIAKEIIFNYLSLEADGKLLLVERTAVQAKK